MASIADLILRLWDCGSRLWVCCSPHVTYLCNLKRNIISLTFTTDKLKSKRNDIMKRIHLAESDPVEPKERTDEVMNWLRRVEAIELEVDEILQQTITTQILLDSRGCCYRPTRSKNCWTDYKLSNLVIEKLTTVNELISEGEFSVVAERCPQEQIQEIPTAAGVVGMVPKLEELWKFVNEDDQVRILGIWGMGGVGKTTLLKKLNNEFSKRSHEFDLVIWAVVSKDLDLKKVQKQITDSLRLTLPGGPDLDRAEKDIFRAFTKKKFVLLLDDIWERIDLQSIGVPSCDNTTHETNKSMVVFTTRSEDVCGQMEAHRKMKVDCLNWGEAWSLFQEKVGKEAINCHPQIAALAEVVAKECRGLPLALNTIGRTMASKNTVHEWRYAINVLHKSASEFPGMEYEVLRILKFSYDNLRSHKIKSCFLYCSLFPEDHYFDGEVLSDYWIAEGFIDNFENINEARDQGHHIIGNLRSVSLLETSGPEGVKMHDVVRDLAIWIVSDYGENNGKYLADVSLEPTIDEWEKAEKILVMNDERDNINLSTNFSNLSTLILLSGDTGKAACGSLTCNNMPKLRVLSIDRDSMFPANIGQLSELRYLNLWGTRMDFSPSELKSLAKLMFLHMGRISTKLPSGVIPCLTQLRVLDLYHTDFKDWEMEGCPSLMELESLKHLNDLGITIGNLVALQKLVSTSKFQLITRALCITDCKGITSVSLSKSSPSLSLSDMKKLRKLSISYCKELLELKIDPWGMQALENLILFNLPELEIVWGNKQLVLPAADQPKEKQSFLSNLQHVEISDCKSIKNLTWLTYAQDLKFLELKEMDGVEEIISDGFLVGDHTKLNLFSNLVVLQSSFLRNLRSICSNSLAFPVLEYIEVDSCPKLKKLPLHNNSNKNNTLKSIEGNKEWWDSLEWDDDTVKDRFSSVASLY